MINVAGSQTKNPGVGCGTAGCFFQLYTHGVTLTSGRVDWVVLVYIFIF
jgi:hypothetical protein